MGTIDDWLEQKRLSKGGKAKEFGPKELEPKADGRPQIRRPTRKLGGYLSASPKRNYVKRIDLPDTPEQYNWLYGKNGSSRG